MTRYYLAGVRAQRAVQKLILISAFGAQAAVAQATPSLSATQFLRPAVDTIAITVETQGRIIPFATAIHSMRQTTRNSRTAWELTYRWLGNDGSKTADTLWIDLSSLVPIENHRHNGVQDAATMFDPSAAHTRFTMTGKPEQQADTSIKGPLYASGELEELIRASPLSAGYGASVALYYGPPGRLVRTASFKVVRSETVSGRNGKPVDCWVVDAPLSEGLNTFFVAKADHRVVRLVNHEDPNATFVFLR